MLKQAIAAFIALSGLSAVAAAQSAAPQPTQAAPAQTAAAPATCALPAIADQVRLEDVPGSDLVTVPVEINGKPKQFLLDISANASQISRATVNELGLIDGTKLTEVIQAGPAMQDYKGENVARDFRLGSTVQTTVVNVKSARKSDDDRARVTVASFKMGDATGRNLQFVVANDNEIAKSAPYSGLMTGAFFKQYDVELDFYGNKLSYLTPNHCADPDQIVFWPHKQVAIIPMDTASGKIEVQVDIAGHKINAVLDTGSARTIMRRDIAENTLGLKANSPKMPPAGDMRDGDDMQIYTATFPEITFAGGVTAFNVPALIQVNGMVHNLYKETILGSKAQFKFDPRIPALTLGMDVLKQLHLYIVYGQNSIYMTAAQ